MKNLIDKFINEKKDAWHIDDAPGGFDFSWSKSAEFLWINTEGNTYGFLVKDDIKSMENDFGEDEEIFTKPILALKPGECFDSDGGINIYIRLR